jgi:hypothetical protein
MKQWIIRPFMAGIVALCMIAGSMPVVAQCTNYQITVTGGTGSAEVSWELFNSNGDILLSGGAPFSQNICLPDDCYTLWMYDSGADGWNNQDWFIADFIGDFDFDTNLADGSAGFDQFATGNANCSGLCPAGQQLYTIDVDDGNDAADVYWELTNSSFSIVASGFAPDQQQLCLPDDCYTLWMYDNGADGWDGETWSIEDATGNILFASFLPSGDQGNVSFSIGNGSCAPPCLVYDILVTDGIDAPNVSWTLLDEFGVVQASGGADELQSVCLLEGCYNLIMEDFEGNGWEEVILSISEASTGYYYQTFLVSGFQYTETFGIGNASCQSPVACGPGTQEYTFSVTAGGNPSEISWYISLNNGIVQGGGAPYNDIICLSNGCYYLHTFDSGANGWEGATYVLTDPAGLTVASGTLMTGTSDFVLLNIGGNNCTGTEPPPPGACGSTPPASDCFIAPCVCDIFTFQITPSGGGSVADVPPPGSFSNPSYSGNQPWGGTAPYGCLLAGELNSYWLTFTIASSGTLEFSLGAGGQQVGFYDWALWPYNSSTSCNNIAGSSQAPVRCVWNSTSTGGTGLAAILPAGGFAGNYAPPLNVNAGDQFVLCMSNWSYVNALVTIDFFGTANIACNLVLPVELLSFEVTPDHETAHLHWHTSTETACDHFEIEHSTDLDSWHHIGEVEGHLNSPGEQQYDFYDLHPHEGLNYYRLKQYDTNGEFEITEIRAVQFQFEHHFNIFPNPVDNQLHIHLPTSESLHSITITDSRGRLCFAENSDRSFLDIDTSQWSNGIYFVRLTGTAGTDVKSIIVQHSY